MRRVLKWSVRLLLLLLLVGLLVVQRYLVNPAQAPAYKVGMNQLLQLRGPAKEQLGEPFVLSRCRDFFLSGGDMPPMLLEGRADAWIAAEEARA